MMRGRLGGLGVVAVLVSGGCSDRTPTDQLTAYVDADIDGDLVAFQLSLTNLSTSPDPTTYLLEPDEHLTVTIRDQTVELGYNPYAYDRYTGRMTIAIGIAVDEPVTFTLDRGGGDVTTFAGSAPRPFTLAAPASAPLRDPLTVTWSPIAGEPMKWHAMTCGSFVDGPIPTDTGTLTFPPGALIESSFPYSCDINLSFARTRGTTTRDAGLLSAHVNVAQFQHVEVKLTP